MPKIQLTKKHRVVLAVALVALAGVTLLALKPSAPSQETTESGVAAAKMPAYLLQRFKGESSNSTQTALVRRVGEAIVSRSFAKTSRKPFRFHLLAEPIYITAFALPGGDVYVTTALVNRMKTEGQLAAALSAGIAHVLANDTLHVAEDQSLSYTTAQESAADVNTVKLMAEAGYDPTAYLGLFAVLTDAYHAKADVPYFATHPSAQWRLDSITKEINTLYPKGVPAVLSK